jgi:hypothetical protein
MTTATPIAITHNRMMIVVEITGTAKPRGMTIDCGVASDVRID